MRKIQIQNKNKKTRENFKFRESCSDYQHFLQFLCFSYLSESKEFLNTFILAKGRDFGPKMFEKH